MVISCHFSVPFGRNGALNQITFSVALPLALFPSSRRRRLPLPRGGAAGRPHRRRTRFRLDLYNRVRRVARTRLELCIRVCRVARTGVLIASRGLDRDFLRVICISIIWSTYNHHFLIFFLILKINLKIQLGASGYEKGFVECFLKTPQDVGLYMGCTAAAVLPKQVRGTSRKNTFVTTWRPRLYSLHISHAIQSIPAFADPKLAKSPLPPPIRTGTPAPPPPPLHRPRFGPRSPSPRQTSFKGWNGDQTQVASLPKSVILNLWSLVCFTTQHVSIQTYSQWEHYGYTLSLLTLTSCLEYCENWRKIFNFLMPRRARPADFSVFYVYILKGHYE